jgi:hypothetical protein
MSVLAGDAAHMCTHDIHRLQSELRNLPLPKGIPPLSKLIRSPDETIASTCRKLMQHDALSTINLSNYPKLISLKSPQEKIDNFLQYDAAVLLQRWVNYHLQGLMITNFTTDFQDGLVYLQLIYSLTELSQEEYQDLRDDPHLTSKVVVLIKTYFSGVYLTLEDVSACLDNTHVIALIFKKESEKIPDPHSSLAAMAMIQLLKKEVTALAGRYPERDVGNLKVICEGFVQNYVFSLNHSPHERMYDRLKEELRHLSNLVVEYGAEKRQWEREKIEMTKERNEITEKLGVYEETFVTFKRTIETIVSSGERINFDKGGMPFGRGRFLNSD